MPYTDRRDVEEPSAKRRRTDPCSTPARQRRELGLMRQNDASNAASFVGSSSGIYFVRSVYSALAKPSSPQPPPETPDQNVVPGEEDQLDGGTSFSSKTLWTPQEVAPESSTESSRFTFEDLRIWTESYFDNWHTAYPFIRAPELLQYLEQVLNPGNIGEQSSSNTPQLILVKSIISISLADQRQTGNTLTRPIPAALVFKSFEDATESVQSTLFKPKSIEVLQAVVAVQLFLVSMLRLNGASRLGGLLVRMAFQMGLHRCPARYPNFGHEEVELRQRLFWTIYCIDRHLCQALGLPLTIRDDDVDVCYFDNELHRHHRDQAAMDDRLRVLNFFAKHASIKGQIVELRNKSIHRRRADKEQAVLIGAQIDKWRNQCQLYLESVEEEGEIQFNDLHQVILTVSRHECVISLYRPLLATNRQGSEYISALQICIHASTSVISSLHKYIKAISGSESRPPLVWPSLTWCVWMSAFIVLHAAIEGEISKAVAKRLADHSVEILRHFSQRGTVWPNVCAVAIQDLFSRLLQSHSLASPEASDSVPKQTPSDTENPYDRSINQDNNAREQHGPDHPSARFNHQDSHQTQSQFASMGIPQSVDAEFDNMYDVDTVQTQTQVNMGSLLSDHAFNIAGPPPLDTEKQSYIPWLSGPDATAATSANIFEQFDIPFWMGDDQYAPFMMNDL